MNKLADKPSQLIRDAIEDLMKVEMMPDKYVVNMDYWHTFDLPEAEGKCVVCIAGATIACRLEVPYDDSISPGDLDEEEYNKLTALDCFRRGFNFEALDRLGYDYIESIVEQIPQVSSPYHINRARFFEQMEALAKGLEALNF